MTLTNGLVYRAEARRVLVKQIGVSALSCELQVERNLFPPPTEVLHTFKLLTMANGNG